MPRCRFYDGKYCNSYLTIRTYGQPSVEPVNPNLCEGDFTKCRFYTEGKGVSRVEGELPRDYYYSISVIDCSEASLCPFFDLTRVNHEENVCVAYCRASERYLTRSSVPKCINYWRTCPFFKIGTETGFT